VPQLCPRATLEGRPGKFASTFCNVADRSSASDAGISSRTGYDGSGERKKPFRDPDAAWGFRSAVSTRRGGGFYGYKLHAAACAKTGLPLAWRVESGNRQETNFGLPLLDAVTVRGFTPEACSFDKGYDHNANYAGCEERGVRPIVPLRKIGKTATAVPTCEHGT